MADKSNQLILDALSRAAAGGAPLLGAKAKPGLFPATAAGKQAASRCREEGYVCPVPPESAPETIVAGKSQTNENWGISEKGLAYLLGQVSPRQVLNDLVRGLENREAQLKELLAVACSARDQLASLRGVAEIVLRQLLPLDPGNGSAGGLNAQYQAFLHKQQGDGGAPATNGSRFDPCATLIMRHLMSWQGTGAGEDYPLPELYRVLVRDLSGATIGQFHDALRRLHDEGKIYLHPWTGPLYDVPEPPCALLIGHEVAYYASTRPTDGTGWNKN